MNSLTHYLDTDGKWKRKPAKVKPMARVSRKRSPTKNRTEYGWKIGEREICDQSTAAGRLEYKTRTLEMAERQGWICGCGCGRPMCAELGFDSSVTFGHIAGRTAGHRDDRTAVNRAERYDCNMRLGSPKRNKEATQCSL